MEKRNVYEFVLVERKNVEEFLINGEKREKMRVEAKQIISEKQGKAETLSEQRERASGRGLSYT